MEKSVFLNRKYFLVFLLLSVFVGGLCLAEPTSAAKFKLFDKGKKKMHFFNDEVLSKISWKAYKKGNNYVKIKGTVYDYESKYTFHTLLYIKKVGKNKLKLIQVNSKKSIDVMYVKTKLSATKYYWKKSKSRPFIMWHD